MTPTEWGRSGSGIKGIKWSLLELAIELASCMHGMIANIYTTILAAVGAPALSLSFDLLTLTRRILQSFWL